jgi:hypothetical protein
MFCLLYFTNPTGRMLDFYKSLIGDMKVRRARLDEWILPDWRDARFIAGP